MDTIYRTKFLPCKCELFSDGSILRCMFHEFEELNRLYPPKFPSYEEFMKRWTDKDANRS